MGPGANRTIRDNIAPSDPDQATRKAGTLPAFLREKAAHEAGAYDAAKAVAKAAAAAGAAGERGAGAFRQPAISGNERGRTLMRSTKPCIAQEGATSV
jgi:hypothetical protein